MLSLRFARCLTLAAILCAGFLGLFPGGSAYAQCVQNGDHLDCSGNDPNGFYTTDPNLTVVVHEGATVDHPTSDTLSLQNDGHHITNDGTITSGEDAIDTADNTTIINNGSLIARSDGIYARENTTVINNGLIQAEIDQGVDLSTGSVTNYGTIRADNTAYYAYGVEFDNAGENSVVNYGTITGSTGIRNNSTNTELTVVNEGTLTGRSGTAILANGTNSNDQLINGASGTINGDVIEVEHVTNAGTINGDVIGSNNGIDVRLQGGVVNGDVIGGSGSDAIHLQGGAVNGTIDGNGGADTLGFEMTVSAEDWEAVQAALAQANPAGGSLVVNGITYTWTNFEELQRLIQLLAIRDRRINGLDFAATAIVYRLEASGVELYTPQGEWVFDAEADVVLAALAEAAASGAPVEIDARLGLALYALPDGSLFATGPGYSFAFAPSQCGLDL